MFLFYSSAKFNFMNFFKKFNFIFHRYLQTFPFSMNSNCFNQARNKSPIIRTSPNKNLPTSNQEYISFLANSCQIPDKQNINLINLLKKNEQENQAFTFKQDDKDNGTFSLNNPHLNISEQKWQKSLYKIEDSQTKEIQAVDKNNASCKIFGNSRQQELPTKPICIQCTFKEFDIRKQLLKQKGQLQHLLSKEKSQIKNKFQDQQNQLWTKINQKQKEKLRLSNENQSLIYEIDKLTDALNHLRENSQCQIKKMRQKVDEQQQIIAKMQSQYAEEKKGYFQVMLIDRQLLKRQFQKEKQDIVDEMSAYEHKIAQKIELMQVQHQETIQTINSCHYEYQRLVQTRHQSQIEILREQHSLEQSILQQQISAFKGLISQKQLINQQLSGVLDTQLQVELKVYPTQLQEQQLDGSFYLKSMISHRKVLEAQFIYNRDWLREIFESKMQKLKTNISQLQHQNSQIKQKLMQRQSISIESSESTALIQLTQPEIVTIFQHQKIQALQRKNQNLQRELKIKQAQLLRYQQIIQNQQRQFFQSQLIVLQKLQCQQDQTDCFRNKLSLAQNQLQTQERKHQFQLGSKNVQIANLISKINKMEEQQLISSQQCEKIECISLMQQIQTYKKKYQELKVASQRVKSEYSDFKQAFYEKYLDQMLEKTVKENQKMTQKLIFEMSEDHRQSIQNLKRSSNKMLSQKNDQVRQLSQIMCELIKINFSLNKKCHEVEQEINSTKHQFIKIIQSSYLQNENHERLEIQSNKLKFDSSM